MSTQTHAENSRPLSFDNDPIDCCQLPTSVTTTSVTKSFDTVDEGIACNTVLPSGCCPCTVSSMALPVNRTILRVHSTLLERHVSAFLHERCINGRDGTSTEII